MLNKTYINANIKTKEEFFQRMKNGEQFFYGCTNSYRCYYDELTSRFIKETLNIVFKTTYENIDIINLSIPLNLLYIEKTL